MVLLALFVVLLTLSLSFSQYTKVKQDGVERINSVSSVGDRRGSGVPSEIIPKIPPIDEANEMPQTVSVSETLKQAKEVLRLAKVVRAEAEQMRDEARRELSIAKKDRHDAMLLKKNAAEILRMAKERLGSSTK